MEGQSQNYENQEIDLTKVSKKIKGFFSRINDSIFDGVLFIKRNFIILTILLILGVGIGIYIDKINKVYVHKMIVIPNFGSVDYLYNKLNHLEAKLKENDTVFFKELGIQHPKKIKKIEIDPIIDIYKFIEGESNRNYEMVNLMAENSDISKVVEDPLTSKNYKNHLITITTKGTTSQKETITPILNYLNDSQYYTAIQKELIKNLQRIIVTNDSTVKQINDLLNNYSNKKGEKLIYYNDNTQLQEVIKIKDYIVSEQGYNYTELINYEKIIRDNSTVLNTRKSSFKMFIVLPALFILLFIIASMIKSYYKKQVEKRALLIEE
jgi:hypothetical protein